MTRKIWPLSASSTVSACGESLRGRQVAEAERRESDEAEVEELGLRVGAGLDEEGSSRISCTARYVNANISPIRTYAQSAPSTVSSVIRRWWITRFTVTGSVAVTSRKKLASSRTRRLA